ncbi:MAG: DUF4833 domain-containing protein [Polyangiaceae bacterium]
MRVASLAAALLACGVARADEPAASTSVVPVFTISKSSNRNIVQYAVRVDAQCALAGNAPVVAYWKMLEKGPGATAPLLEREVPAYGMATARVLPPGDAAGQMRITLKAAPDRTILIETTRQPGGGCLALATTTISGAPGHLFDVYVRLNWLSEVDCLLLEGWSMTGKTVIRETLKR